MAITIDMMLAAIIAAGISLIAGGGYIASIGNRGGLVVTRILAGVLLLIAFGILIMKLFGK